MNERSFAYQSFCKRELPVLLLKDEETIFALLTFGRKISGIKILSVAKFINLSILRLYNQQVTKISTKKTIDLIWILPTTAPGMERKDEAAKIAASVQTAAAISNEGLIPGMARFE